MRTVLEYAVGAVRMGVAPDDWDTNMLLLRQHSERGARLPGWRDGSASTDGRSTAESIQAS